jgi:hypothetical protein
MAQHDMEILNSTPALVRQDINAALLALATNNAGPTAPTVTYPTQFWADTSPAMLLKIRNTANTAWVTIGSLNTAFLGLARSDLGLTKSGVVTYDQIQGFDVGVGGTVQSLTAFSSNRTSYTSYTRMDGFASALTSAQGVELLNNTVTVDSTYCVLRFDICLSVAPIAVNTNPFKAAVALFRDNGTAPLATAYVSVQGDDTINLTFFQSFTNAGTSVYKVRFGATTQNGTNGDGFYFNAQPGALSSSVQSSLTITEMTPSA